MSSTRDPLYLRCVVDRFFLPTWRAQHNGHEITISKSMDRIVVECDGKTVARGCPFLGRSVGEYVIIGDRSVWLEAALDYWAGCTLSIDSTPVLLTMT